MQGYHRLADIMRREKGYAFFRQFSDLNLVNLLSLQAELIHLRKEFWDICHDDDTLENPTTREFSANFSALFNSIGGGTDDQLKKLLEIRKKLEEYCRQKIPVESTLTDAVHRHHPSESGANRQTANTKSHGMCVDRFLDQVKLCSCKTRRQQFLSGN